MPEWRKFGQTRLFRFVVTSLETRLYQALEKRNSLAQNRPTMRADWLITHHYPAIALLFVGDQPDCGF